MTNIAKLETRPSLVAGNRPMAVVPSSMEEAYRLAEAVCKAGMAPRGLDTPEKAMIAILHGLELGLTPMNALQRIAVVNGRPTIFGDGAMSIVRASGLCEYVHEHIEGDGDGRQAICEAKRRGESTAITRTFSVVDAKKAGLWGKSGPWQQFPERMLQMRARGFALRDLFADALGGLYLKEEFDGVEDNYVGPSSHEVIDGEYRDASSTVSSEQVAELKALCAKLGKPDAETTLARYFRVEAISELPASLYDRAVAAITKKIEVTNG